MNHDAPESLGWYCLRTAPKREHLAAEHLRRASAIEVFCPRLRTRKATTRGAKWFVEAMFPGYVFAHFPFAERHREVQYSPNVTGILAFGGQYARLPDDTVAALKQHTDGREVVEVMPDFSAGANVKIIRGALAGLEAVVTQVLPARERVRILLNFLGKEIQAEVASPDVVSEIQHPLRK